MSQKKTHTNFEMVKLEIIRIDFDDIWQKYSKTLIIEFACFSFHIGLLCINFSSFTPNSKNNAILTLYQANSPTLTSYNFLRRHIPKLMIFGTHNLQTFKRDTLINELLLMQFYLFNIRPKLHHWKRQKLRVTLLVNMHINKHECVIFGESVH